MTDEEVRQQAREKIAEWYFYRKTSLKKGFCDWGDITEGERNKYYQFSDEFLALKDKDGHHILEIRHPDQSFPRGWECWKVFLREGSFVAELLKHGWVRVVQPEKGDEDG